MANIKVVRWLHTAEHEPTCWVTLHAVESHCPAPHHWCSQRGVGSSFAEAELTPSYPHRPPPSAGRAGAKP